MRKKTPDKVQQDAAVDALYPFLPPNYAALVQHFFPEINAKRLYDVIRKRGTEPDPEAMRALLAVKKSTPVARKPRKKGGTRTSKALAA